MIVNGTVKDGEKHTTCRKWRLHLSFCAYN